MEKINDNLPDISEFKILTFKEVKESFSGNKNFFEKKSSEIVINSPFGKKSAFYRQEREIITGQIPKL